jgi:hypothetical protein
MLTSDKGGTSTDISRYDGNFEHIQAASIAGRTIATPMLDIATVAAGGGSILFARNGLLVVGPEVRIPIHLISDQLLTTSIIECWRSPRPCLLP